jgi:hypothetical protein
MAEPALHPATTMVMKPSSRWPHLAQERAGITIAMPNPTPLDALFNKNVSA